MSNVFEEGLHNSMGMFLYIQDKAQEVITDFVDSGRIGADEGRRFIDNFDKRLKNEKKEFRMSIDSNIQKILDDSQVATKADLSKIMIKLDKLADKIADIEDGSSKNEAGASDKDGKVLGG